MTPNGLAGFIEEDVEQQEEGKSLDTKVGNEKNESWPSINKWELIQLSSLVSLGGLLIATLVINKLKNSDVWEVELWRTCLFILVIFCGNIISRWLKDIITFLIVKGNRNLKNKFVYLIYVIVSSSSIFIWLGLIMIVWLVLIRGRLEQSFSSDQEKRVIHKISRAMASTLVGLSLWYGKIYVIKLIASSFQMKKFFSRIRDAMIYKFVLQKLEKYGTVHAAKKIDELEWDYVEKVYKTVQDKVTAIYMTQLIKNLSLAELVEFTKTEFEEQSETKVNKILAKIQHDARPSRYIDSGKLNEAIKDKIPYDKLLSCFGGNEVQIEKSEFRTWMIEADKELRNLAAALQDSNTAIDELNLIFGVVVGLLIVIVWLLVMGIMTTEVLVFISSQLLVWSFIFSDTSKTVFEGIIFNFVAHPLDVGDKCIIEGTKMTVEEMGLLSTNFQGNMTGEEMDLLSTNTQGNERTGENGEIEVQKIHYSNSKLAGMRIINLSKTSSKDDVSRIWTCKK